MADGEQIHSAMYPGSFGSDLFSRQTEINVRQHALEARCFVVCATAWLDTDQQAKIMRETGCPAGPISSGCFTAIISPQGELLGEPLRSGEGVVIADLDFALINERKRLMDFHGHYGRPGLLSLSIDRTPAAYVHERGAKSALRVNEESMIRLGHLQTAASLLASRPGRLSTPSRATMKTDTRRIQVDRWSISSSRPFDEIVSALDAALGHPDIKTLLPEAKASSPAEMKTMIEKALGPSGFMEFMRFEHGKIIAKETTGSRRIERFVIGNPLVTKEMVSMSQMRPLTRL